MAVSARSTRSRRRPSAGALRSRAQRSPGREWRSIETLRRLLSDAVMPRTLTRPELGIGDDAAVLSQQSGAPLVWTIDGCVEGVHFRRKWLSLSDVGWRATQAAVSDVAAMGARPIAALCQLVLPAGLSATGLRQLGAGQAAAARQLACPVVGGNVSAGPRLELATTVLGEIAPGQRALERSGARPGDELWLIGEVGLAAAGLIALRAGVPLRGSLAGCAGAWRRPQARVAEGLALQGRASACIDVSDGLVGDAAHLAEASEVALVLDQALLEPVLEGLALPARKLGVEAMRLALWGGEDYALLATGPKSRRPRFARVIGWAEEGEGVQLSVAGKRRRLRGGFQHLG